MAFGLHGGFFFKCLFTPFSSRFRVKGGTEQAPVMPLLLPLQTGAMVNILRQFQRLRNAHSVLWGTNTNFDAVYVQVCFAASSVIGENREAKTCSVHRHSLVPCHDAAKQSVDGSLSPDKRTKLVCRVLTPVVEFAMEMRKGPPSIKGSITESLWTLKNIPIANDRYYLGKGNTIVSGDNVDGTLVSIYGRYSESRISAFVTHYISGVEAHALSSSSNPDSYTQEAGLPPTACGSSVYPDTTHWSAKAFRWEQRMEVELTIDFYILIAEEVHPGHRKGHGD
ncbi:hypothetical protein BGY98DRAFT_1139856 [Russula aff. rugulosa BPL654]|nr:hypothetical protein BGY98DRAFT_1139856 [Russula aff. rugulosa BPL654]